MRFDIIKIYDGRVISEVLVVVNDLKYRFIIPPNAFYSTNGILFVICHLKKVTIHFIDASQSSIVQTFVYRIISAYTVGTTVALNFDKQSAVIINAETYRTTAMTSTLSSYNDANFVTVNAEGVFLYNIHTGNLTQQPKKLQDCRFFDNTNYRMLDNVLICTITEQAVATLVPRTTIYSHGSCIVINSPIQIDNAEHLGEISPGYHRWQNLAQIS